MATTLKWLNRFDCVDPDKRLIAILNFSFIVQIAYDENGLTDSARNPDSEYI